MTITCFWIKPSVLLVPGCNPSFQDAEAGGSGIRGHCGQYRRPCLKQPVVVWYFTQNSDTDSRHAFDVVSVERTGHF